MTGYAKRFDETKYMYFLIKDDELLKKIIIKPGIKSTIEIKDNFIANQSIMKNI